MGVKCYVLFGFFSFQLSSHHFFLRLNAGSFVVPNGFAISMNMIGRKSQRGQHFAESRIFRWLMVDVDHKFPLKCGKTAVLTPPPNKVDMRGEHYTQVKQSIKG